MGWTTRRCGHERTARHTGAGYGFMKMEHADYATKSDVAAARSAMILWCVGTIIAMSVVAFAVARLVH